MLYEVACPNHDVLLRAYLHTREAAPIEALDLLLRQHAAPVIWSTLRRRCRGAAFGPAGVSLIDEWDREDLHGEVVVDLLTHLAKIRENPDPPAIHSFPDYVAVMTHHAVDRHCRGNSPFRCCLKNRVRSLLKQNDRFALWEGPCRVREGGVHHGGLCGRLEWQGRSAPSSERLLRLHDDPRQHVSHTSCGGHSSTCLLNLMEEIFTYLDHPLDIDDLVSFLAVILEIADPRVRRECELAEFGELADLYELGEFAGTHSDGTPREEADCTLQFDALSDLSEDLDGRQYLHHLWSEIRQLPSAMCAALLLNLRDADGDSLIDLLPQSGLATVAEIAHAVDLPVDQLTALWDDLPLGDKAIAKLLGITCKRVGDLRSNARKRLTRRMKGFDSALE